jgi:RNA polymerase sigma factor (TIGR02999 family)
MSPGAESLTNLLQRLKRGDADAESALFDRLYHELKRTARSLMTRERTDHTLTPTALVNSAYLRLREIEPEAFQDHQHFLRLAARVMKQLLIDHARARIAAKRPTGQRQVDLEEWLLISDGEAGTLIALDETLAVLHKKHPAWADAFELRYFGGYTHAEVGAVLGKDERTAKRYFRRAQLYLAEHMYGVTLGEAEAADE